MKQGIRATFDLHEIPTNMYKLKVTVYDENDDVVTSTTLVMMGIDTLLAQITYMTNLCVGFETPRL